ncbi:hypothetical protein TNCV_284671 [Trichonephila clavipes]|uniref:Uncharacterized protein n=1 Tax=Trichonephila clavipes TaxID=2585209 RepID=A0A8X6VGZ6_TRICX|nr:hypothetical protein TNCV_284671 [Trichonephila clavipes]
MRECGVVSSLPSLASRFHSSSHQALERLTLNPQSVCKIYPLFERNSALSRENKLLIYTLILRPVVTYAAPIWIVEPLSTSPPTNECILTDDEDIIVGIPLAKRSKRYNPPVIHVMAFILAIPG